MPLTCRSAPGSGKGSRIWVKDMTCRQEHPETGDFLKYDKVRCKNWPSGTGLKGEKLSKKECPATVCLVEGGRCS